MERKRCVFLDLSTSSLIHISKGNVNECIIIYAVYSTKECSVQLMKINAVECQILSTSGFWILTSCSHPFWYHSFLTLHECL
jgi:hypothetical protein